jgi:uncharacterized protein
MAEAIPINYDAVWEHVTKEFQCDPDSIHGPNHWRRVERNALKISASNGANVEVLKLFAVFHDSRRQNDSVDSGHGERGTKFAEGLRGVLFNLSDDHSELLRYACVYHASGQLSDDPTIGACWDADRLDLTRIGQTPKTRFMCNALGRSLCAQE